jgi:hypothetical protein
MNSTEPVSTPISNISRLLRPIAVLLRVSAKRITDGLSMSWCVLFFLAGSMACFGQSATKLAITTHPVFGGANGSLMIVQPVVEIRDASDQLVTTSTAQVEIEIASGNGGTIGGTTRINAVNGIATFTDLTFSGITNESYTFTFKSEPVIVSEPFAYTGGTLLTGRTGGTGWSGAWFGPSSAFPDLILNTTGLSYTNFSTSGARTVYNSGTGGDAGRLLAAASNAKYNVVWLAFLGNYSQQGGGFNNMRLLLGPSTLSGAIGGNDNYANWSIMNNTLTSTAFTSTPLNGTTRLALVKIDYTAGSSSLWMDPVVSTFDGTQTPSMSVSFAPVFDRIDLYNRSSGVSTDEITLASTYKAALHLEQNLSSATSIGVVLPVTWTYFTASCNDAQTLLKWGTANESANSHFIVEKSTDASLWSAVGRVEAAGNSYGNQQYQFRDSATSLTTYYRLRQVDRDGRTNLSKIIAANCKTGFEKMLRVFPNPARDILQIAGAQPGSGYELMDAKGYKVRTGVIQNGTTTISLTGLPEGNYFIKLGEGNSRTVQVMKAGR